MRVGNNEKKHMPYIVPDGENPLLSGFSEGMSENTGIEICGKSFYKQNFEKNYELCFDDNGAWQVDFSFDISTKQLSEINFWYGVE